MKNRLEGFSDGVFAIIMTIMVLQLKVPRGTGLESLKPVLPVFLSYVLSFIYVAIYWNNHHHLLCTVERVSGGIQWANLHLIFWVSLFPLTTGRLGENHAASIPVAAYAFVLFMAGLAYLILQSAIMKQQNRDSLLRSALGRDWKGKSSCVFYLAAVPLAFLSPWIAISFFVLVALMWFVPDRRIERVLERREP